MLPDDSPPIDRDRVAAATLVRALPSYAPSELELLAGGFLGEDPHAEPLRERARGVDVLEALEDAIRPYVARPPCIVAFSGGRDSSIILGAAARLARREHLPAPIPASLHFPGDADADEDSWQEAVIRHLELDDWLRIAPEDFELIGSVAGEVLRTHGVLTAANAYFVPLFEHARGGALLTGVGGDELFGTQAARFVQVLAGRARPKPSDAGRFAYALLPLRLRQAIHERRKPIDYPWVRAPARPQLSRAVARWAEVESRRWDRATRVWWASRYVQGLRGILAGLGAERDVHAAHPFLTPTVIAEVTRVAGPAGFRSRSQANRELFGDVVPDVTANRATKAHFANVCFGPRVRDFADTWDGTGLDHNLVDPVVLTSLWRDGTDYRTALLLQTAWLACA